MSLIWVELILNTFPVLAVLNVLFVNVSVVALPTSVSVLVGSVSVPVLTMDEKLGVVSDGLVASTTDPVPVTAVIDVPLILNEFPVPAVSYVLFVKVSVVALPTSVSVLVGSVSVPVFTIDEKLGVVNDGLVANTTDPVPVTAVIDVPLILNEFPVPAVSYVLFVKVSVVALPTSVSAVEGKVILIFDASETGDASVMVFGVPELSLNESPEYAMVLPENVIVFELVATTVLSMLRVLPVLSSGAVTCTCPAPEN